MTGANLLTELISNMLAAGVAAVILLLAGASVGGYGRRVICVALMGLLPGLDVDLSYWNWYGFPANYTAAQFVDHVAGWLLMGLALAAIIERRRQVPVAD